VQTLLAAFLGTDGPAHTRGGPPPRWDRATKVLDLTLDPRRPHTVCITPTGVDASTARTL